MLFAGSPAFADDDDEPVRDEGVIGNLMKGLGATDGTGGINYRERSPLVVPRNLTLPPPEKKRPEAANWPKDPDVLERRAARDAAKKRDKEKENDPTEQIRTQPEPDLGQARARTATVVAAARRQRGAAASERRQRHSQPVAARRDQQPVRPVRRQAQ